MQSFKKTPGRFGLFILATSLFFAHSRADITLTTLTSLSVSTGSTPSAKLTQAPDGSFYGTAQAGGINNQGTVFRITSDGVFSNLFSFTGTNGKYPGANPAAGLVSDTKGNFYGTTQSGGANGLGTIFQFNTNGTFVSLVSFTGTNGAFPGANPAGGLTLGTNGQLYGTTQFGGTNDLENFGDGTVFALNTNGTFTSLISFSGTNGTFPGANPTSGLILGTNNLFYGTTYSGGTNDAANYGDGTIFQMNSAGGFNTLFSFNTTNGANPRAGLTLGTDNNFYGTTYSGGQLMFGTIFKITTAGKFTLLFSFNNTNGANPYGDLSQSLDGNLYGTTQLGGTNHYGTIFLAGLNGSLTSLFAFSGTNGDYPAAGLTQGVDGNLYGTTASGTTSPQGTIFRFTPPPKFLTWYPTNGNFRCIWNSATGQVYQLQFKTNLSQTTWNNLGGAIVATDSKTTNSDVIGPNSQRFYRVNLVQ
ncbi:MAG TPA: choice-of-anchor tandem repeat GloVer-containing protein [Verrucomicrobiae bacterium]|nr:choice-of-anchor tandem repeat GloVer-containing protein [Verrucomicrobiae bacterium]